MNWVIIIIIATLLAGLSSLTYYDCRLDIVVARARLSSGSHVINNNCSPIEYDVAGQGPPVL